MKNKKKVLLFIFLFVLLAGTAVTVYITQFTTRFRSKATAATTLSFSPLSKTVHTGDQFSADITVDPGTNQVSAIQLRVVYDQSKIATAAAGITANKSAFPQTLEGPFYGPCQQTTCTISYSLGIGADPTKVITTPTTVATITFVALATSDVTTQVTFSDQTKVYSTLPSDNSGENVLSSTNPLTLQIISANTTPTPPACQANTATCQWDAQSQASSYHFKIEDITSGSVVKEGDTSQATVSFTSIPGDTYRCSVTPSNVCGPGKLAVTTNACVVSPTPTVTPTPTSPPNPSATPTPTPGVTATPTPSPTPAPSCNSSCNVDNDCTSGLICLNNVCRNPSCGDQSNCACLTPTATPTVTPTPTPSPTPTPTSPPAPLPTPTPTPTITPTPTPTPQLAVVTTQQPTTKPVSIPKTGPGDTLMKIGIAGAILTVIGAAILFVL